MLSTYTIRVVVILTNLLACMQPSESLLGYVSANIVSNTP
jgi:hypothetical protein